MHSEKTCTVSWKYVTPHCITCNNCRNLSIIKCVIVDEFAYICIYLSNISYNLLGETWNREVMEYTSYAPKSFVYKCHQDISMVATQAHEQCVPMAKFFQKNILRCFLHVFAAVSKWNSQWVVLKKRELNFVRNSRIR